LGTGFIVHCRIVSAVKRVEFVSDEELEQVLDHFPKYHIKILVGDFNAKVDRQNILKSTIGQMSLHQDRIDNGVKLVNFPH